MDNASKALIIAGAILIAVMLVSLGVMLYNTAAGVAEGSVGSMTQLGVQGFNGQFETYFGGKQSREQARGLIRKVIANNANINNAKISINDKDSSSDLSALDKAIGGDRMTQKYDINATADGGYNADGYLVKITITGGAAGGGTTGGGTTGG